MPLWSDDFDRADGPLGDNWAVKSGAPAISGNKVVGGSNAKAMAGPVSGPGAATVEAVVDVAAYGTPTSYLVLKANADWSDGFVVSARTYGGNLYLVVGALTSGGQSDITEYAVLGFSPSTITLRAAYSGGVMSLYYDGNYLAQYTNSTKAANSGIGLYVQSATLGIYSFTASGDGSPQLIISPRVIGTDDGDQLVSLLGVAVTWTPGVPGSPSFTVNAGALSSQQISSTTNATVVFSPPATAQTVTLDDPANGISSTIQIVEGTFLGGGQGGPAGLSSGIIDWLTQQAAHGGNVLSDIDELVGAPSGDKVKKTLGDFYLWLASMMGVVPEAPLTSPVLYELWRITNGQYPSIEGPFPEPNFTTVDAGLGTINDVLTTLTTTYTNLATLVDLLGGTPTIYSNADIMTAIGNIAGGDNQEVLDAIAAAQGDPLATIKAVLDLVYSIGTTSNYTLASVLGWINAAQGSGNPTIRDVMNKLGTSGNTIEARIDALSDLIVTETTIQGMLDILATTVAGRAGATIGGVLDALELLPDQVAGAISANASLWPGVDFVTLGQEVALVDGMTVTGTMNGVIVKITTQPPRAHSYPFGDIASWSHVGQLVFLTDNGDQERAQSFGLDSQVLTPKTMEDAGSCVVRLNAGWGGTIQPWAREA